ncbi:hypothetical protein SEA_SYRA333_86 [Mycobacterium phage Syra333]|uniref:Uncharacterized protein n=1 Tax=Mycobacterium phage Ximenita TaxID=2708633 RepID=A0A6G6XT23_9CAUD|nr:hypothetical protein I5G82_gp019 [Mycobacterium phage Ximenita]QIG61596.1 hypothetical protein SEA_XIMENITA_88 [Mycobacterium phage Ximenita]WNM69598.1 hypothetical protein SEA_SYRA333_86 [Mycobacterium phage Syra333]
MTAPTLRTPWRMILDEPTTAPDFRHARDIPDAVFCAAVAAATMSHGVALRGMVNRVLGGLAVDDPAPSDEVPGVPYKVVLAKFRRCAGRGLVTGCDCGCRGDWELTRKGRGVVAVAAVEAAIAWFEALPWL